MALCNFGKKKEEEKKTPACACSCGCAASEAESITHDCCPDLKEGGICCIKVLAGCKSCHEQFEYTKQAVKDMGLSVEVEYITDMQKVMEYGVMSMPALVVNEKVVAMGKVLKAADVVTLGDLVQFNKTDLLKFRNFGKKSLTELDDLLESLNLSFGTDISKYKLDKE